MSISCDCVPTPRVYEYGNSEPDLNIDARAKIEDQEYLNDSTIDYFNLPYCQSIGQQAFKGSSIKSIQAPECQIIKASAFASTQNWSTSEMNNFSEVKTIGEEAFYKAKPNPSSGRIKIDISNVETIGRWAFRDCFGISYGETDGQLILPKCKTLGEGAFSAEYSNFSKVFSYISLPSIEILGERPFLRITLTGAFELHIGPNCTKIDDSYGGPMYSFYRQNLTSWDIYIEATTPPIGSRFAGDEIPTHLYVPAQSVEAYKSHSGWGYYSSVIEAIPT